MRGTGLASLPLRAFRGDIADEVYADAHAAAHRRSDQHRAIPSLPSAWRWPVWPTPTGCSAAMKAAGNPASRRTDVDICPAIFWASPAGRSAM